MRESNCDILVVGATAAGTAAAVSAARAGASVLLIEETTRVGGMCSNGLGVSDIRSVEHSYGFFDEFRKNVVLHYGVGAGLTCEPGVANSILTSLVLAESKISFAPRHIARAIVRDGNSWAVQIKDLATGESFVAHANVVIDATVEADLAAAAGVEFRVGREPRTDDEPHAGRVFYDNATDEILPGSTGVGDGRIQSYAYLLTVKDYGHRDDRTIPRPDGYDPRDYRYSPEWELSWAFQYGRLPNGKFELNQHPWGGDLPGINYYYPTASRSERKRISPLHLNRALGYLYYLQIELGMKSIGLCEEDYPETGGLPESLYVREARRMIGRTFMRECDITLSADRVVEHPIAVGDYPMDSHATAPALDPNARHRGEGEFWLVKHTPVYRVPLGVILPRSTLGMIVPTAVSASHVAYGTLRMEPVRMQMGQAAGVLAAVAVQTGLDPSVVPYDMFRDLLDGGITP